MVIEENKVWLAIICITHVINDIIKREVKSACIFEKSLLWWALANTGCHCYSIELKLGKLLFSLRKVRSEYVVWIVVSCTINIALIITFLILAESLWLSLSYGILLSLCIAAGADPLCRSCADTLLEEAGRRPESKAAGNSDQLEGPEV